MKEQLDLVKILKDCPKGTKFYSRFLGSVEFCNITSDNYIEVMDKNECHIEFKSNGTYKHSEENAEIDLFPSKDQRDWSKLIVPKFKDEDEIHRWTIQDAKEGDVLAINWYEGYDYWEKIVIFKKYHNEGDGSPYVEGYGNTFKNRKLAFQEEVPFFSKTWTSCLELATKEQHDFLFQTIKEAGYKWNQKTKTLEKLIEPKFKVGDTIRSKNGLQTYKITGVTSEYYSSKIQGNDCVEVLPVKDQNDWMLVPNKFDTKTLQPFDKVLVRQYDECWHIQFFETMYEYDKNHPFRCLGGKLYSFCIPYAGNEHLLNTINEPSEFYRYWEN